MERHSSCSMRIAWTFSMLVSFVLASRRACGTEGLAICFQKYVNLSNLDLSTSCAECQALAHEGVASWWTVAGISFPDTLDLGFEGSRTTTILSQAARLGFPYES